MLRYIFFVLFLVLQVPAGAIVLQRAEFIVHGKITDQEGAPLAGATVTIENTTLGVNTLPDGSYSLSVPGKGTYSLKISFMGYETKTQNVKISGNVELNISLSPKSFMTDEVFVSATRAGEHTPLTWSAVTKAEIAKTNIARDIPYILNYTPSLVVSSDAGTGVGYTNINIRGTDVKRINVTIDGIPVNDAESHGVWWVDLPDLASSTDNIQVQRGVGTSTNGAGAFGATINFQSTALNREPYAEINSSYGSFNTSKNTLSFGTGLLNNKFTLDARLSKIWSDGYIDRAFSDLRSFSVAAAYYGKNSILKLSILSGVEHTYQAWDGVPKDSLKTHRTYNPYSYRNETDNYWQDNYQLHYSKEINSNLNMNLALHYTAGHGYYENLVTGSKFSDYNLPDAIFSNDTVKSSDFITQRWLRNYFYGYTYSFNYTRNKFSAVLGGGWNKYNGNHFGDIIWAKIVTFDGQIFRWYEGTGNKRDLNNFLKINYTEGKLNLYADLQLRDIYYSIGGYDEYLKNVGQTHRYNFFNPKGGLVYNFSDKQKVYASFGVSHREPDRSNFTDADPGKTPVPEKLYDLEGGYQYNSPGFMLKGNIYYMYYSDQLIQTGKINSVGATILVNVPESYREGIEIETGIQVLRKLHWYANLTLSRNIIPVYTDYTDNWDTYLQESQVLKNRTISFSPPVVAGSVLDYNISGNLHLSIESKYVGKQYIDNTGNEDRMLKAYSVHNLSVSYSIKSRLFRELTFRFMVNNLLDAKYETNAWVYKYLEGGNLHIMDGYFPQAGINYMLNIDLKF